MLIHCTGMEFSEYFVRARTQAKLSQTTLAEQLGIKKPAISKWENGKGVPRIERAQLIAQLLHISAEDLIAHIEQHALKRSKTMAPPHAKPDTAVQAVDRTKALIQTEDTKRDVPQLGINPRAEVGDFEMGVETGAFVRRPAALSGRDDVRALRTKSGDLLFLESEKVRPPREGDDVAVVMKSDGEWAPAYLRRMKSITDETILLDRSGASDEVELKLEDVARIYRVLSMADLFG